MIFKFVFEIVAVSGDNKLVIVLIASKYIYIFIYQLLMRKYTHRSYVLKRSVKIKFDKGKFIQSATLIQVNKVPMIC